MGILTGKSGAFYRANGTPVVFTQEAMTDTGDGKLFKITDATKAYWDHTYPLTFEKNSGSWVACTPDEVVYAGGMAYFNTAPGVAVRVSGKYLPLSQVGGCFEWSMQVEMNVKDWTCFGEDWERCIPTVGKFSGSASRYWWITYAILTTTQGSNKDLTFSALAYGPGGNAITVAYINAGASKPLQVSVAGNSISVQVATNGTSVITSTANDILAAVNVHPQASLLVRATLATGSNGTGVVAAMTATNLAGGMHVNDLDAVATDVIVIFYTDAGAAKKRFEGVATVKGIKPGAKFDDIINNPIEFNGWGKPYYHAG